MKKNLFCLVALLSVLGCYPRKGVPEQPPIEVAKQPEGRQTHLPSNEGKIGISEQEKEAQRNAGEVGPNAAAPINKKQFKFGPSAGTTTGSPRPEADAAGEVFVERDGVMSERQVYPGSPRPSGHAGRADRPNSPNPPSHH